MSKYFPKEKQNWIQTVVRGGTVMQKSVIWEASLGIRSAFYRMPAGMQIPEHTHPDWVQVMVIEGEMEIESKQSGKVLISAGACYFVEPGDTHTETAVEDSLVLVTQAEDR